MKDKIFLLISLSMILLTGIACNATGTVALPATSTPSSLTELSEPANLPTAEVSNIQETTPGCEESFQFCVTSMISGSISASGTGGMGSSFNNNCAAWVAAGDPRILELPMMIPMGENKITVALTRIGAYTGPGSYELKSVVASGMPDMFPTISVDGRTFSSGEESTAVVTIAPDGSGSIQALGLIELASIQVSNPDPSARVDFSMQWTCQETK